MILNRVAKIKRAPINKVIFALLIMFFLGFNQAVLAENKSVTEEPPIEAKQEAEQSSADISKQSEQEPNKSELTTTDEITSTETNSDETTSADEIAISEQTETVEIATPLSELPENSLERFEAQFYDLKNKVASLSRSPDDYEELYAHIRPIMIEKNQQLYALLIAKNVDLSLMSQLNNDAKFRELFSKAREIKNFYLLRQKIFNQATDEFRELLTSSKLNGITEAKLEGAYVQLQVIILSKGTWQRILEIPERFQISPVDISYSLILIIVAIFVMRIWRKWAKTGLPELRQKILAVRPRTAARMKFARAIWYFEQTRKPIEWLLFINFLLANIDILQIPLLKSVVGITAFWICLTYFVYGFLTKMIERGKQNVLKDMNKKKTLSLKAAIWWAGWYKLSFELTALLVANGTIFSWLESTFLVLILPIYAFFIFQWRSDCFQYVDDERDTPPVIRKLVTVRVGLRGFLNANIALLFVVYFFCIKFFMGLISKVESGRRLTAEIYRKKLLNDNKELLERTKDSARLSVEQNDMIIHGVGISIDSVFAAPVNTILKMAESNERSHVSVIGERGIGKTYFLHEVKQAYPSAIIINCTEDFDDVLTSVKQQLQLDGDNVKTNDIIKALREQEIDLFMLDNCHRLLTPDTSGQREIRRLYGWINELKGEALWVMSFDSSSWNLFNALGIANGFFAKHIQLKKWSEDQISQLFDNRCKGAEIDVDYSQLIIPRQLADMDEGSVDIKNKTGMYRIIWGYADGNPAIACRTLADAIVIDNDKVIAKLPSYPQSHIIEGFEINSLLVLRVISQFGRCRVSDVVQNLRLHGLVVNSAIAACVAQGIIEQIDGRYQISWLWYRTVSKFLARQNLLTR
ncbi:hypothetical protein AADZ86_10790 [Colwelliaceae bacterium BS250]